MVGEGKELNIYLIHTKEKFNKKLKIELVVLILLILTLLIFIAGYSINIIRNNKIYKQYEEQLAILKQQEIERQEEERRAKIPELTEQGKENIKNIYHSDTKRAFLTFDDGPSSVTNTILDVLKQENVKATFFVLGSRVEAKPDVVKRIYDEGHFIANHGYSHVYKNIYQSPEAVLEEYNKCNQAVRNAIGEQEYNSHLFRFPGGLVGGEYADIKNQANDLLLQNNIVHVDWNALNGDSETTKPTVEYEIQRIVDTTCNKQSIVILMHDAEAKKVTVDALPSIIDYLKGQGYEFKNFYEIIK